MKRMFEILNKFKFLILMVSILTLFSCKKTEPEPDPEGTVSININTTVNASPILLYKGAMEPCDYFLSGGDTVFFNNGLVVRVFLGIDKNINFATSHHYGDASNWGWFNEGVEFVDVGMVDGLGELKSIPQAGWSNSVSATKGHGYFVRYKHSINLNDENFPLYYAILYVEDYLTSSVNGGIIGIKLKYKNPF